jgi:hypothetical protein
MSGVRYGMKMLDGGESRQGIRNAGLWVDFAPFDILHSHPHSENTAFMKQKNSIVFHSAKKPFTFFQMPINALSQIQTLVLAERP